MRKVSAEFPAWEARKASYPSYVSGVLGLRKRKVEIGYMSCSIWEKGAKDVKKKSNKEGIQASTYPVIFSWACLGKDISKVCEICQEASKPILLHERACQVWQCWTQCDRMWQMHSLLSLFSRYYLPGPHTYDGPKFENEWCYLTSLWSLRCPHPAISLCQRYPRHICHGYHGLYPWRKKCRVEKFQISVKN